MWSRPWRRHHPRRLRRHPATHARRRAQIVKSRIQILAAAAAHVDLRWMPLYWRARARLGLPLSSLELTHARPPSAATVDAVLSLLVDECPGAQNEEAGGRGARRMVGPKARAWLVSIRTTSTESRDRSPGAIPGRAGDRRALVVSDTTCEGKGLKIKLFSGHARSPTSYQKRAIRKGLISR